MCETNAYLLKEGAEELYLENIDILKPEGDELYLRSIFGEEKTLRGRIKEINLKRHRIVIEQ